MPSKPLERPVVDAAENKRVYNRDYYAEHGDGRTVDITILNPVSYKYAHKKVARVFGPASGYTCVDGCGEGAVHWSYMPGDAYEQTGERYEKTRSGGTTRYEIAWSPNVYAYAPRCLSCHADFDRKSSS